MTSTAPTIMHGYTFIPNRYGGPGYGYLAAALERMDVYRQRSLDAKGIGAVTGGFIFRSSADSREPWHLQQSWGTIDRNKASGLGFFYDSSKSLSYHPHVCFAVNGEAPVVSFWRNNSVVFGPNEEADKADWGQNVWSYPDTAYHKVSLTKVKSATVVNVEFPALDDSMRLVTPELIKQSTFTNDTDVVQRHVFEYSKSIAHTHSLGFKESFEVKWTAKFKATVPLLGEEEVGMEAEVGFEANQTSVESSTTTFKDSTTIDGPPHSTVVARATYSRAELALDAKLTIRVVYENGSQQTVTVPVSYNAVSAYSLKVSWTQLPEAKDDADNACHVYSVVVPSDIRV